MSLSITQELKATFHLATLRHEAKQLLTGRQWEKRAEIETRCTEATTQEKNLFNERYEARIALEVKRLQNQAGSKKFELKPNWATDDQFSGDALLGQADKNVRNAHQSRLDRIDQFESHALETLMHEAAQKNQIQGKAE